MDKEILELLAEWHKNNEYQKIVDAILAIPEEERDYELIVQLARALNNLGDYETATEMLLGVEEEGKNDPLWYYRLGYAYYYSDRFEQAKEKFEQVLRMTPDDEDAGIFLDWCNQELTPEGKVEKLNERLIVAEVLTTGKTFRQRTEEFWQWFLVHEPELAALVEKHQEADTEEMIRLIAEGVSLISEEINFNIGGDYEFTFTVEGKNYLFYLLPWLVARMPEQLKGKWHFFPCMQGTGGESFGFQMYGKNVQLSNVMVGLKYHEEQNYFDVRFYDAQLASLGEDDCYNAFYIMMELTIGEAMSYIYIHQVDKADALEEGMFPLTKLEACITVALEEAKKEILMRPDERYSIYQMQFESDKDLRYDMVIGTTCFPELLRDYFNESTEHADKLAACGAKAVFLVMPMGNAGHSEMLKLRYELEDRLAEEILGEKGSGRENGILLGGTMGREHLYIDLLLYDMPAFMRQVGQLLDQYAYPFYLAEFRPESRLVALAHVDALVPEIPSVPGELAQRMITFMDCPCRWFAPMADADSLDKAYFEALEVGKKEGFVPILVTVDEALLACMTLNVNEQDESGFEIGRVRAYRRRMLQDNELPDASVYLKELTDGCKEEWEGEEQWAELMGEMKEGEANNDLSGSWNYDTHLTEEMLLVEVPVDCPWKVFAWLPIGDWNKWPDTSQLIAVAKHWNEIYGTVPALIAPDVLEFYTEKPVENAEAALHLSLEHYVFCPDCVEQSGENNTVGKRADSLLKSTIWYFEWD